MAYCVNAFQAARVQVAKPASLCAVAPKTSQSDRVICRAVSHDSNRRDIFIAGFAAVAISQTGAAEAGGLGCVQNAQLRD